MKDALHVRLIQLLLLFYSLFFVSITYSENSAAAFAELELKSSIAILPLVFFTIGLQSNHYLQLLKAYILGCFIATSYSLLSIAYDICINNMHRAPDQLLGVDWVYFSYFLPKQINLHSPYFSMYLVMAIFILAYLFCYEYVRKRNTFILSAYLVLILYFVVFTIMLASRTALLAGFLITGISLLAFLIFSRKKFLTLALLILMPFIAFKAFETVPYLKRKLQDMSGMEQRQTVWSTSIDLISENILFGLGTGDTKDELVKAYKKNDYNEGIEQKYDPHNQYIQITLALGIVGLLVYILIIFTLLATSINLKNLLLAIFTVLFVLCGITESNLTTQKGVIFFSFFVSLFAILKDQLNKRAEVLETKSGEIVVQKH
ncbi:O-antigen ligase family protein [Pontibacter cellulosilyticus]|uniref:O-antigen ligase family protein n=1 Tax=Pontibacter cellulosilyticus TaxID=1720253 RepID=A0A923N412_9BACT|nr:O-antigen ligase family protein [Pontibacter cellulosilyticus]MBC5992113.1 O-antigen ligase family protein [Pontibacter cellulosilyticus]